MDFKNITPTLKEIKDEGLVAGVFATLNTVDLDGDVTLPGAFGQQNVKVCAWGHNWATNPVGKGTIGESGDEAVFDAQFFLNIPHAADTFQTVKALGDLQEWSYGFEVVEAEFGEFEGREVRFLKRLKVFEVSPVMRGAGVGTRTTVAKSALPFTEHAAQVVADTAAFIERAKARRDHRAEAERVLSVADREQLAALMGQMRESADGIKDILTEPPEKALGLSLMIQRTLHEAERRMRVA